VVSGPGHCVRSVTLTFVTYEFCAMRDKRVPILFIRENLRDFFSRLSRLYFVKQNSPLALPSTSEPIDSAIPSAVSMLPKEQLYSSP
jgi:hypothetical protein